METYKNIPKLSTIERIAEALDVPVLDLFVAQKAGENDRSDEKSAEDAEYEDNRRQKIREHLKKELLARMESDLDDVLRLI